jgi:hypothetical protein
MEPADFPRFRAVLAGMAEVFQRELSPALLDAYWLALRDWRLADFEAGAARLLSTATFMPRPADFTALRKACEMTPEEAWDAAIAACPGWRDGTAAVNPRVDRVVRMLGGYERLAMERIDTQHFTRTRFLECYESTVEAEETRAALPHLAPAVAGLLGSTAHGR